MDLWCLTGPEKKKKSEWREETEAEKQGGRQEGRGGGTQYGPVAAPAKKCRCASVKEDLGFG